VKATHTAEAELTMLTSMYFTFSYYSIVTYCIM
jgi:hypothetical protein